MNVYQLFKKKGEYRVIFYFPDSKMNGVYPKIVMSYAVNVNGIPIGGNLLLEFIDTINKKLTGGSGVNGTLTLTESYLEFKPVAWAFLLSDAFHLINIPLDHITEIRKESLMMIAEVIVITTINGEFKLQVLGDFNMKFLSSTTDEIYNKIHSSISTTNPLPFPPRV